MKSVPTPRSFLIVLCLVAVFALGFAGCTDALRFAPSEPQKQSAELTYLLAAKVNAEGAMPASPATVQLVEGTRAATAYIGRPAIPPDPEQFDTLASTANTDALARPDLFTVADEGLSLAAELAILFGVGGCGFGGKKVIEWLMLAKQKSAALKEIIAANELFKQKSAEQELFKQAQNAVQSVDTKKLVAIEKLDTKTPVIAAA